MRRPCNRHSQRTPSPILIAIVAGAFLVFAGSLGLLWLHTFDERVQAGKPERQSQYGRGEKRFTRKSMKARSFAGTCRLGRYTAKMWRSEGT